MRKEIDNYLRRDMHSIPKLMTLVTIICIIGVILGGIINIGFGLFIGRIIICFSGLSAVIFLVILGYLSDIYVEKYASEWVNKV